jgi:hypothetical protein
LLIECYREELRMNRIDGTSPQHWYEEVSRMSTLTIGITGRFNETYFDPIKEAGAKSLIDDELNNISQLFELTKNDDLIRRRDTCSIDYLQL